MDEIKAFLATVGTALGWVGPEAIAGLFGGGISGGLLPGPLALLDKLWKRVVLGAVCGCVLAAYAAQPLAAALERPEYLRGVGLGLGLFGLSFAFKLMEAWNAFDARDTLRRVVDKLLGRAQ